MGDSKDKSLTVGIFVQRIQNKLGRKLNRTEYAYVKEKWRDKLPWQQVCKLVKDIKIQQRGY